MVNKVCHGGCECHKCKITTKKKKSKPKKVKIEREIIKSIAPNMRLMTLQSSDYTIQNIPSQFNTPKDILDIKNSLIELLQKEKKKLSGVISTQTEEMKEMVDDISTEKALQNMSEFRLFKRENKMVKKKEETPKNLNTFNLQPKMSIFNQYMPTADYFRSFDTGLKEMVDGMSVPPKLEPKENKYTKPILTLYLVLKNLKM